MIFDIIISFGNMIGEKYIERREKILLWKLENNYF